MTSPIHSQNLTQTIRGTVVDVDTKMPLPGVNVTILDSKPILGASTDTDGQFRIASVPLGRISLLISYVGYEQKVIPNILVTSAKEIVLDIEVKEALINMDEIVITSNKDKSKVPNEMALVSARGFTVEETKRYAGSFNDPARMVSGYAGVNTDASGSNFIIVRGNSPKGIQWRLEGIEIPNPNHFSDEGATGGPINALSSRMLANSEFYSGAFAPEYGNALSGVFDMSLRKGNNEKRESSFSIGVLGTDITTEGPFSKNGNSSYLLNYRYSTLTLLNDLGLVDFDGIPKYQDLSFKVHIPTKSLGTFSVFGLGGLSKITESIYDEDDEDDLLQTGDYTSNMGVAGITQYLPLSTNTYLQNSVSVSQNGSGYDYYEPNESNELIEKYEGELNKNTIKGSSTIHHKFNASNNLQAGIIYTWHTFDFYDNEYRKEYGDRIDLLDIKNDATHYQGFISWKYRPLQNLSFVTGFHAHGTNINDDLSIEPRFGARWQFNQNQAFTAGFGIHGKMESLTNYYAMVKHDDGTTDVPNTALGFTKARHYVVGYENLLGKNLFMKLEAYYQQLYDIPVENDPNSSYSLINQVEWFTDRELVNEGTGTNVGLEFTLERYFAKNYYFLLTTSLFDSKYKAMDGVERNTRFNSNYLGNFLFGKEFELNTKSENKKVIGVNTKVSLLGARRYSPIDLEASRDAGYTVREEDKAFSKKGDDVLIINLALTYRIDNKKTSQEFKIDIQNLSNNAAILDRYYDDLTDKIEYSRQLPLLPVAMYTIHF